MAMETTSCPILNTFRFYINNSYKIPRKHLQFPSFLAPRNFNSSIGKLYSDGWFVNSSSSFDSSTPSRQLAILLQVEGYNFFFRFYVQHTFRKLGLDLANWSQPVYQDLVKYDVQEKIALDELVMSKALPLRPGVEEFIDEACEEGVPVVMLTAYCRSGEKQVRSIIEKLGNDKMAKIKIIGIEEVKRSSYGQLVFGEGVASDLGEQLAKEARKAVSAEEQRIAKEVASILKLTVDIDTTSSEGLQNVVAALRAGAEYANVPVHDCVLVSGSLSGVAGAERIGMPCVVVRSSSTARAEFPGAKAIMDGFGGADLSISRLRQMLGS
ncbi:hypothetical protein RND71_033791 [Anisodus tanguticus]|uniref:Uncharacterized protein n=1 Tax=Anisodus tanguticus TaxID=243964 RepID=A0AAE1UXT4_9SOLA|nr:hypothetical protein RND71_033791 [Anisodus tanguticus]